MKTLFIAVFILTGVMLIMGSCTNKNEFSGIERNNQMGTDGERKGEEVQVMTSKSFGEQFSTMKKFFFEKGEKYPEEPLPLVTTDISDMRVKGTGLKVTWLGHSSLLINMDGKMILTDPVFQRKISPIGPTRFEGKMPLKIADLTDIDAVIISHDHYDHLNKFSVQQLKEKAKVFIVPLRVGARLVSWGVPEENIIELDWWSEAEPQNGLTITATPSKHFSGRGLFDRNATLWASWVISTGNHRIFFSGDSGYFSGFQEIGEKYGPFDAAFLECGAYNEGWSDVHMFPEQTARAAVDLKADILQPIHWATFNLSLHSWYEPVERLLAETGRRGVRVSTPKIGQIVNFEEQPPIERWWVESMERSNHLNRKANDTLALHPETETAPVLVRE